MIELRDAITKAKEFIIDVYEKPEEVVLDSAKREDKYWLIKVRIPLNIKPINSLQNVLGINKRIFYKIVRIDENGEIIEIIDADLPQNPVSEIEPQAA